MTRLCIAFQLFFQVSLAFGHDGRPLYLELLQLSDSEYELAWRIPSTIKPTNIPNIYLERPCEEKKELSVTNGLLGKRLYDCIDRDVSLKIGFYFPETNPSLSSVVRVQRSGFPSKFLHASPGVTAIKIPSSIDDNSLLSEYGKLGVEHILGGYDHLLFLLCVVWLAFTFKRIVLAVTGFTIAHSITLGVAALSFVNPAVELIEALIALSIIFVAAELARQSQDSLSWRYPVAVSSVFGLLHGFGFANVLKEIGLPTSDILMALLAFNLGVELGQLLFIVVLILLVCVIRKASAGRFELVGPLFQRFTGFFVGILATVWFFERLSEFS